MLLHAVGFNGGLKTYAAMNHRERDSTYKQIRLWLWLSSIPLLTDIQVAIIACAGACPRKRGGPIFIADHES